MTLRKKTLLIIGATLLSLNAVLYVAASTILMQRYTQVEQETTSQNVERALNTLKADLDDLDTANLYWSMWDDTYLFVNKPTQKYIDTNIYAEAFTKFNINLITIVNNSGEIVLSKAYDLQTQKEIPTPPDLPAFIAANKSMLNHASTNSKNNGILMLSDHPLLFTSKPIITTQGKGPIAGSLILGQYLNYVNIERLSKTISLPLNVHRFNEPQLPADFQIARNFLISEKKSIFVKPKNQNTVAGYTRLLDISGKPSLLLGIETPRVIYNQGKATINYLLRAFLIIEMGFGIVSLLFLEKIIISRLSRLSNEVNKIGTTGNMKTRVLTQGQDELSRLANDINSMLQQLEESQTAIITTQVLKTANVELAKEIGERKRIEQALFQEKELAQVTLQSIGDAVITTDDSGCVKSINPIAERLTGWKNKEAIGLPLFKIFNIFNENTRAPLDNQLEQVLCKNQVIKAVYNTVLIARDGREFAIDHCVAPIHASDRRIIGTVLVFRDVTQSRYLTRQLAWEASHDALTKLFNRQEFEELVGQAINNAKTFDHQHVLFYLDLDRFKIINDTCGHIAGDELLRQVSSLFQAEFRKTDIVARLGGDEFGVLLYQCSLEQAVQIAEILRKQIQEFRFQWEEKTFNIGVSIGLVVIDSDSQNLTSVLTAADTACYAAKNQGRNRVHVYQPDDSEVTTQRNEMEWVSQIPKALENNLFRLYYQKVIPVAPNSTKPQYHEILLRLEHENGYIVPPMAFIPAAERYDLMHLIDRWVISTLFTHLSQAYSDQNYPAIFAVNLSGVSINDDQFVKFVRSQFAETGIAPSAICFEITETTVIRNLGKAAQLIRELKTLGCSFALDDFGSGMSSFAYLKNLPVDYLKIDGVLIKDIVNDAIAYSMVEAISRIASVMGIETIAEFVENDAIRQQLKPLNLDYAQGFGIAKPCPLNSVNQPSPLVYCS